MIRQPKYSRWGSGYQGTKPFWAIQTDTAHMAGELLNGVLMNGTIGFASYADMSYPCHDHDLSVRWTG